MALMSKVDSARLRRDPRAGAPCPALRGLKVRPFVHVFGTASFYEQSDARRAYIFPCRTSESPAIVGQGLPSRLYTVGLQVLFYRSPVGVPGGEEKETEGGARGTDV